MSHPVHWSPVQGISLPPPSPCCSHCPLTTHINLAYIMHLMCPCRYSWWTAWLWKWRHFDPTKNWELFTCCEVLTLQKTWIFSNTTVRTWNLTTVKETMQCYWVTFRSTGFSVKLHYWPIIFHLFLYFCSSLLYWLVFWLRKMQSNFSQSLSLSLVYGYNKCRSWTGIDLLWKAL